MESQNSDSQNEFAKSSPLEVYFPNECEFSHFVGGPAIPRDEKFDAAQFDALLTGYDRILLRFGMHIAW